MLTAERLRELLEYDPVTGEWHWRVSRSIKCPMGKRAGSKHRLGYTVIGVDLKVYSAHRLAFLYVTGQWPHTHVDHEDGDKSNNKFTNLRQATRSQNLANRGKTIRNSTGYKGVYKSGSGWYARIGSGGVNDEYLGQYRTPEAAAEAYLEAARRIYGEFGRD